mmetsp:Transcript_5514/g.11695  ORF Transcript_5514/g.11695 Transcript_5514/m.11695 type:complete len:129 (+) Transcript_5514:919-1305(+)
MGGMRDDEAQQQKNERKNFSFAPAVLRPSSPRAKNERRTQAVFRAAACAARRGTEFFGNGFGGRGCVRRGTALCGVAWCGVHDTAWFLWAVVLLGFAFCAPASQAIRRNYIRSRPVYFDYLGMERLPI